LVEHGKPATDRAIALFEKLREIGFKTCLLSNNKEYRVKPFADAVSSPYIYKADKPSRRNYYKAMEIMGTDISTTIFIGDQLFTDVYGARRTGIYSVLTSPIDKKEEIQIVLKRYLEKIVLYFYRRAK
jgi:HAD superfamily phosphatase (TIGR01668 family)